MVSPEGWTFGRSRNRQALSCLPLALRVFVRLVVLAQQVLAVVVSVRRAHHAVNVLAGPQARVFGEPCQVCGALVINLGPSPIQAKRVRSMCRLTSSIMLRIDLPEGAVTGSEPK